MAGRNRRARQPNPADLSSTEYRTQEVSPWSQPSQNPGNEGGVSYSNTWTSDNQEPSEIASTYSDWDREMTKQLLYQPMSEERDATDIRTLIPQQDGIQPGMQHSIHSQYAEQIPHDALLFDTRTQHRFATSNTAEAERHWSGQNDTYNGEDVLGYPGYDTSHLYRWPHNQHAIEDISQSPGTDPNSSSFPGMSSMLATRNIGHLGSGSIESPLIGIGRTQTGANPDPWSVYQPSEMRYPAQQGDTIQEAYPSSISGATPSTFGSDNLEPSRQVVVGPQSYVSSDDKCNESMDENILTPRLRSLYVRIPQEEGSNLSSRNPLYAPPGFIVRPATPPIVSLRDATYPSASDTGSSIVGRGLLSPTPESMTSDTHSCASDTSSPAAPPEIYCDIDECCIAFSGRHRKGNLARHKRHKHRGRVYVCENASCERVFNRQDARLKHYRTHHQRLATPYIARPETRHANRDRDQYSDFMSSTSG